MIQQITVFLENTEGRLASMCRAFADAGINMSALTIAETSDYGVARIICDDPAKAKDALNAANFRASVTNVTAVAVPNEPGGLAQLLETLDAEGINIEYAYCFSLKGDEAVDVIKVRDAEKAESAISAAGFSLLEHDDLY